MRKLTCFLLLLLFSQCSEPTQLRNEVLTSKYPSGKLQSQTTYVHDSIAGVIYWDSTGRIDQQLYYTKGNMDSSVSFYYRPVDSYIKTVMKHDKKFRVMDQYAKDSTLTRALLYENKLPGYDSIFDIKLTYKNGKLIKRSINNSISQSVTAVEYTGKDSVITKTPYQ
jgi:antitoxin component YwqK of YwqJK toxin-antitoxin module